MSTKMLVVKDKYWRTISVEDMIFGRVMTCVIRIMSAQVI